MHPHAPPPAPIRRPPSTRSSLGPRMVWFGGPDRGVLPIMEWGAGAVGWGEGQSSGAEGVVGKRSTPPSPTKPQANPPPDSARRPDRRSCWSRLWLPRGGARGRRRGERGGAEGAEGAGDEARPVSAAPDALRPAPGALRPAPAAPRGPRGAWGGRGRGGAVPLFSTAAANRAAANRAGPRPARCPSGKAARLGGSLSERAANEQLPSALAPRPGPGSCCCCSAPPRSGAWALPGPSSSPPSSCCGQARRRQG